MHILCMEDDEGLAYLIRDTLEQAGFEVTGVTNGADGLEMLHEKHFDAAIVDHEMPVMTGLDVINESQSSGAMPPIIMITGAGSEEIAVQAMRMGAGDYLVKDTNLLYLKLLPTAIERLIRERELKRAKRAAEIDLQVEKARSQLLTQFIRGASHEFRIPLSIIGSSSSLLALSATEPNQQRHLNKIHDQVENIDRLVDRLLLLSTLDSKQLLPLSRVDLESIISMVVDKNRSSFEKADVTLQFERAADAIYVQASSTDLVTGISEIIENAQHATSAGGDVIVSLDHDDLLAYITVRDTGMGITSDQLPHIFERFYRADESHHTRGFGLGLPIAARTLELHHGDILVESEPNVGTLVTIRLPLAK